MNHLIAKVKGGRKCIHKNLLAGVEVYRLPQNLEQEKIYEPGYQLEEDEWFVIRDFSHREFCPELLKECFNSTDYELLRVDELKNIEYLCSYQNRDQYYFQRIFKHSILVKKQIRFGETVKLETDARSIELNDEPDALYIKSKDKLYFKKLETITPIFKGIEMLYREATKEETEQFLGNDFVETSEEYTVDEVGKANRKRIAMAIDTLRGFNAEQKKRILRYTHEYYPDLKFKKGKFFITSNEDLKFLLWGIEQRYYTTPVTGEPRVANSVSSLEKRK